MNKVKITVLKTEFYEDIAKEYGKPGLGACKAMQEGQVFYADVKCPEGFCNTLANGGGKDGFFYDDWTNKPGIAISSCNDGFRPVIFNLEATDIKSVMGE